MKRALRSRLASTAVALVAVAMPVLCTPTAAFAADQSTARASYANLQTHHTHHTHHRGKKVLSSEPADQPTCPPQTRCDDSSWGG